MFDGETVLTGKKYSIFLTLSINPYSAIHYFLFLQYTFTLFTFMKQVDVNVLERNHLNTGFEQR